MRQGRMGVREREREREAGERRVQPSVTYGNVRQNLFSWRHWWYTQPGCHVHVPNRVRLTFFRSSLLHSPPLPRKLTCTSVYAVWPVFFFMEMRWRWQWRRQWRHRQTVNARSISVSAKTISLPTGDNKSGRGNVHNDACAFSNPSSPTRTGMGPYLCFTSAHITHLSRHTVQHLGLVKAQISLIDS